MYVYTLLPWSLLRVLHSTTNLAAAVVILEDFLQLADCDLDPGVSPVLKALCAAQGQDFESMLHPQSDFAQALFLLATSKTMNNEAETNFARATSARSYMRGMQHDSSTMCAKHCVAELAHIHAIEHTKNHDAHCSRHSAANLSQLRAISDDQGDGHQAENPTADQTDELPKSKRSNSWILFRDNRLDTRPALLGESKNERRLRVTADASADFKNAAYAAEVENLRQQAINTNQQSRVERKALLQCQGPMAVATSSDSLASCSGPWQVFDNKWPVAEVHVKEHWREKAFVKKYDSKWCAEHRGLIAGSQQLKVPKKPEITFCMKLGGCYHKLTEGQQQHVLLGLQLLRNIARAVRKFCGKRGKLPLVVFAKPSPAAGSSSAAPPTPPELFLINQPHFKPYDMCLWRCKLQRSPGAEDFDEVCCPTSFSAKLLIA